MGFIITTFNELVKLGIMPLKAFKLMLLFSLISGTAYTQTLDSLERQKLSKQVMAAKKEKERIFYALEGNILPEFNLELLLGDSLSSESLKGKPTVINFWNSYCSPCVEEVPLFNQIQIQFGDQINYLAITFQNEAQVNDFLSDLNFNFTHIINAAKYTSEIGLPIYPQTLILDKNLVVTRVLKDVAGSVLELKEFKSIIVSDLTELIKVR